MSGTSVELNNAFPPRLPDDINSIMSNKTQNYGIPENYNPADHPAVKLRHHNHNHTDQSETQRKRRSKNRLSNRRSTGYVPPEIVEEALKMGDHSAQKV